MTHKILKINILIILLSLLFQCGFSQSSLHYTEEDVNYRKAVELYEIEKYAVAQEYFNQVIEYYGNEHTDIKADAEYYSALCAIRLFNADAEYRISEFITKYPESPRTRVAYFELACFKYRNRKYNEAIGYFNKVWKQNLSHDQLYEYYFKKGYAYFKTGNLKKSAKMFYEILNKDSKFSGPANYYYSHVAYLDKKYETALIGFKKLKDDPTFAPVVPYYLVQIYYLQGRNEKVLDFGPQLLAANETKREAEIARLVGEAMYQSEHYSEALDFLEMYKQKAETYTRQDMYQLGYAYYMTLDYQNAVATFTNITNVEDELTQNAYFHMADCYLKMNKKDQARMAFEAASNLDFNGEIKEISLLNYAKLSYELSFSPFNETIQAFDNYLVTYPNSIHKDEAYGYLVKVYLTSKNYKEALASINKIKVKSPEMLAALQRVSYYRGLELFNNLKFSEALAAFDVSLSQRAFDKHMYSLSIYWKAEALYRMERYQESAECYNKFLLTPGAYSLKEYNNCYYNLGYCFFKLKDYKQAISWYRKYTDKGQKVDQLKRGDAFIRIADCYFVERQYIDAIEYYNEAQKLDTFDVDYAIFQKGFSYGLIKQYEQKNKTLSILIDEKPLSTYAADALYERGRSFVALDSVNLAIADFEKLIQTYPNSIYKIKTLLKLGLLHYSTDNYEQALKNYKQVVTDYPGTTEANDALLGIKNIYVDMNKVDDYFAFANEYGGGNVSVNEKDSLTYLAAEKIYMTGKWEQSTLLFNHYLDKFPNGKFAINAHYYRGDCYYRAASVDSALADFQYVINKPKNIFTEQSLLNAALITQTTTNDSVTYNLYNKLENLAEVKSNLLIARMGQMKAAFHLNWSDKAIESARRVLMTDKVSEEEIREARMVMAKSYRQQGLLDAAITQFRILAQDVKNTAGAEAKYRVIEILYEQHNLDLAEQTINEFIDMGTPHQYWLAKAFLLWSDIYLQRKDSFQAKATLQSLIENYKITTDGILDTATKKLDAIITEENKQFKAVEKVQDTLPTNSSNQ